MTEIGCVLLVGGRSRRMGRDKAQLRLSGRTYIEWVAAEFSTFSERILSGGDRELPGFRPVADLHPDCGPMGGLYSALTASEAFALVTAACDMPFYSASIARFLMERLTPEDRALVPVDPSGRVQPLCGLYTKNSLPFFKAAVEAGELRMLPLLETMGARMLPVPAEVANLRCYLNVNRPEEIPDEA